MKNVNHYTKLWGWVILFATILTSADLYSQRTITGTVTDELGNPIAQANIAVSGSSGGTATDDTGHFSLQVNNEDTVVLLATYIGKRNATIHVPPGTQQIQIQLQDHSHALGDIEILAPRIGDDAFRTPWPILMTNSADLKVIPSISFYDQVSKLPGIQVQTGSFTFPAIMPRGFANPNNVRFVQLVDNMDNSSPMLGFSLGNIVGISELDFARAELVPGAASALFGPNAFNGILMLNSKNPIDFPGLSAQAKFGITDADNFESSVEPMYEVGFRYAWAIIPKKLAVKVNASFLGASDWRANDYTSGRRSAFNREGSDPGDPFYDGMNLYGDETPIYIPPDFACQALQLPPELCDVITEMDPFNLRRTGIAEEHLLNNHDAKSLKLDGAIHYRFGPSNNYELSYSFRYGKGSAVYQGSERYALRDFTFKMQKVELMGKHFNLRAYMTQTDDGDSYNLSGLGTLANEAIKPSSEWVGQYLGAFLSAVAAGASEAEAHQVARGFADQNRPAPGTPEFDAIIDNLRQGNFQSEPLGAGFIDDSRLYHAEGSYTLPTLLRGMELMIGGNYRLYAPFSDGTVLNENPDGEGDNERITNSEFGGFLQIKQALLNERLKLSGSIRYDKNENFEGQFSPRIAAVYLAGKDKQHAIHTSFLTGFRNPSIQEQFIFFPLPTGTLLGGTRVNAERYGIYEGNAYTLDSWQNVLATGEPGLLEIAAIDYVKPERVQTVEAGYKGIISDKLYADINVYHSRYKDFVSQQSVVLKSNADHKGSTLPGADEFLAGSGALPATFRAYTNTKSIITSTGMSAGLDYQFHKDFHVYGNYTYTTYDARDKEPDFDPGFNRPEHMFVVGLRNTHLWENAAFDVSYRWQDEYEWDGSFGYGTVEAAGNLDASASYTFPEIKTTVKIGATNIIGSDYKNILGGPSIGRTAFVGITYGLN